LVAERVGFEPTWPIRLAIDAAAGTYTNAGFFEFARVAEVAVTNRRATGQRETANLDSQINCIRS
jgi:hypothetical protein